MAYFLLRITLDRDEKPLGICWLKVEMTEIGSFIFFLFLSNFKPLKNHVLIHILVRSIPLHYTLYILTNNTGKQVFVSGDPLDLKVYHTIKDIFLYLRGCSVGWVVSNFKRKTTCIYRISLIQILFLLLKHADS